MPCLLRALRRLPFALAAVALVALVAGCGGSPSAASSPTSTGSATPASPTPTSPAASTGAAQRVYVVQQTGTANGSILQFAATGSGSVTPAASITPGTPVAQVATDKLGNIYFFNGGDIVEYASGATGTPAAMRQINGGNTSRICCLQGLAVSPDGAIAIGQDSGEIDEWSPTATGSVAPDRYILGYSQTGGGASGVLVANQVAVDASDNLYVAAAGLGSVPALMFSATAAGDVAPSRTLGSTGSANGLTVDSSGNVYVTSSDCTTASAVSHVAEWTPPEFGEPGSMVPHVCRGTISVYAAGSTSTSTPMRVITGSSTQLGTPWGIKVDAVGNIYVVSTGPTGTKPTVLVFSATASGDVAPMSSFTSTAWTSPGDKPSIAIY